MVRATDLLICRRSILAQALALSICVDPSKPRLSGFDRIVGIIEDVNSVLKKFQLTAYRKDPRPHASVAWKIKSFGKEKLEMRGLKDLKMLASKVVCKVGDRFYAYEF